MESGSSKQNPYSPLPTAAAILKNEPELTGFSSPDYNAEQTELTSGEYGIVWQAYMDKVLFQQLFTCFAHSTIEPQAKRILEEYTSQNTRLVDALKLILQKEQMSVPLAFTSEDIDLNAPKLFDDLFHIAFLRLMAKTTLGSNAFNLSMSYREDVRGYFSNALKFSDAIYNTCTKYIKALGILPHPPYMAAPKGTQFVQESKFLKGVLTGNKRPLSAMEVSFLFSVIKANNVGVTMMKGFAQVAKDKQVAEYFTRGEQLAQSIADDITEVMMQNNVYPRLPWSFTLSDSKTAQFSDKFMMGVSEVLTGLGIAGKAANASTGMRSDLVLKMGMSTVKVLNFGSDGLKLMIDRGWLEEPPLVEKSYESVTH